jgi:DNA mismatch endonuclease Vsr
MSDTQAYRQFGNAVVVPVVEEIERIMVPRSLTPERHNVVPRVQFELPGTGNPLVSAARSRNMAAVKCKNTKPELLVLSWLRNHEFQFRLYREDLPGMPEILLPKYKRTIFVRGCFWHSHECQNSGGAENDARFVDT